MGFFGLRKKDNFVDLTEKYKKQQEKIKNIKEESSESASVAELPAPGIFGMFGGNTQSAPSASVSEGGDAIERRKKLAKRLMDMTDKIEDLSNQIFHLQQRIDILESKSR